MSYETKVVTISVRLPAGIADRVDELQARDPEYLGRVLLYGVTRRSIYQYVREGAFGEH